MAGKRWIAKATCIVCGEMIVSAELAGDTLHYAAAECARALEAHARKIGCELGGSAETRIVVWERP